MKEEFVDEILEEAEELANYYARNEDLDYYSPTFSEVE